MGEHFEEIQDPNHYSDDPDDFRHKVQGKRPSKLLALLVLILSGAYVMQTTLAANISLNSGTAVEFGQGISQTVSCSGATNLSVTPNANFTNASGGGAFYFSSITISNIPTTCYGKDFTIKAFGNTGNSPLALFNTTSTDAVVYNNSGSFEVGTGGTGLTVTSGSGSFTTTFSSPVALSSSVFKITIESGEHSYGVGATGPGGGKIFYYASAGFSCGPTLTATCNYLEAAPTSGTNAWTDAGYVWSGNTNTLIGTTGTAIGTGYKNTLAMVAQSSTAGRAGTITRAYRGPNNLTDWFLPSKDELNQLHLNRTMLGTTSGYWSSSETDADRAWDQGFNGIQGAGYKYQSTPVRPIRAF